MIFFFQLAHWFSSIIQNYLEVLLCVSDDLQVYIIWRTSLFLVFHRFISVGVFIQFPKIFSHLGDNRLHKSSYYLILSINVYSLCYTLVGSIRGINVVIGILYISLNHSIILSFSSQQEKKMFSLVPCIPVVLCA